MTVRKKSEEIQKAESHKIQEKVHQILYCDTDSDEHQIYKKRFQRIIERSDIDESIIKVDEETAQEYQKRIERKLAGEESLDKTLVFYEILNQLSSKPMSKEDLVEELENNSKECVSANLFFLEKIGFIEYNGSEYNINPKIKKLLIKTK